MVDSLKTEGHSTPSPYAGWPQARRRHAPAVFMDARWILKALYGPGPYAKNAARSLGCSQRFVERVCQGLHPMPRRWRALLERYAALRGVLLDRELARRVVALEKRYQHQQALVAEVLRCLNARRVTPTPK